MKMKYFILAYTTAILSATGANAADAIIYEEPVPVMMTPSYSWGGTYIGGQIGYGWGKARFDMNNFSGEAKPRGILGGVYMGYNFDLGNRVVLGLDGDATYNNLKETADDATASFESRLRWSGAVRARAGYAINRFLPYISGGVAFGQVQNDLTLANVILSQKKTFTGWTAGAGVDYAATDRVIVRLEYRYTDYGRKDFDVGINGYDSLRKTLRTNDVRLGVAYKF